MGDLLADPQQQERIVRPTEVGDVGHQAQVVHLWVVEVLRAEDLRDVEVLLGKVHAQPAVLQAMTLVKSKVIWAETGANPVHHTTHCPAVVPVSVEVCDQVLWNDGIDPSHHGLLRGHALSTALNLVLANEGPDQAEDQLQVPTIDILWACVCVRVCVCVSE